MLTFRFLGTGCPVATPLRYGPAHLIEAEGARVLIDCGSGVAQQLKAAGTSGAAIDRLIVTHYHSDHLVDFYHLVISAWHQGRERPWIVHATPKAITNMRAQLDAFADERALRIAHERRPSTAGLEVVFHEIAEGEILTLGALRITAVAVDHRPVEPAFGLRTETGDAALFFTGDTRPCPVLAKAARGVDLLVSEVFVDREMQPATGIRSAATVENVRAYHMVPAEIAALAREAGAGLLALTHLVPPAADRAALLRELRAGYAGPVVVGEDLMRIDLPERLVSHGDVAMIL